MPKYQVSNKSVFGRPVHSNYGTKGEEFGFVTTTTTTRIKQGETVMGSKKSAEANSSNDQRKNIYLKRLGIKVKSNEKPSSPPVSWRTRRQSAVNISKIVVSKSKNQMSQTKSEKISSKRNALKMKLISPRVNLLRMTPKEKAMHSLRGISNQPSNASKPPSIKISKDSFYNKSLVRTRHSNVKRESFTEMVETKLSPKIVNFKDIPKTTVESSKEIRKKAESSPSPPPPPPPSKLKKSRLKTETKPKIPIHNLRKPVKRLSVVTTSSPHQLRNKHLTRLAAKKNEKVQILAESPLVNEHFRKAPIVTVDKSTKIELESSPELETIRKVCSESPAGQKRKTPLRNLKPFTPKLEEPSKLLKQTMKKNITSEMKALTTKDVLHLLREDITTVTIDKSSVKPTPRTSSVKPATRTSLMKPPTRTSLVKPTPRTSLVKPTPRKSLVKPTPRKSLVKPTPRKSLVKPTPRKSLVKPTPRKGLVKPTPRKGLVKPTPRKGLVKPTLRKGLVKPTPRKGLVEPTPRKGLVEPTPRKGLVEPTTRKGLVEPTTRKGLVEPTTRKGLVEPTTRKGLVEPTTRKGLVEPTTRKGLVEPTTRKGLVEPTTRKGLVEPTTRKGLVEPTTRKGLVEPTTRKGLVEPTPRKGLVEPTPRKSLVKATPRKSLVKGENGDSLASTVSFYHLPVTPLSSRKPSVSFRSFRSSAWLHNDSTEKYPTPTPRPLDEPLSSTPDKLKIKHSISPLEDQQQIMDISEVSCSGESEFTDSFTKSFTQSLSLNERKDTTPEVETNQLQNKRSYCSLM